MFERIIVTLDGSSSSEAALPAAEELARRLGSALVLLHVIEARPPKTIHGERHLASAAEAEAYLAPIASRLSECGLRATAHVHDPTGSREPGGWRGVAASVAAHEAEFHNDLAVMAAHGRRGISESLSGSLPLKVAASGGAAVLLVPRPPEPSSMSVEASCTDVGDFAPRRLLAPLDGQPDHEAVLPAAVAFAKAFGLGVTLVAVVPRSPGEAGGPGLAFARLAPALSGASLEYAAAAEESYLSSVAERLAAQGVKADWRVLRGRPVKAILASAQAGDLIFMATHRKLGLDASLDGCVAFGVASSWRGAMLITPIPRTE
jgi:nucleotide-binding universal stress UspA family protein